MRVQRPLIQKRVEGHIGDKKGKKDDTSARVKTPAIQKNWKREKKKRCRRRRGIHFTLQRLIESLVGRTRSNKGDFMRRVDKRHHPPTFTKCFDSFSVANRNAADGRGRELGESVIEKPARQGTGHVRRSNASLRDTDPDVENPLSQKVSGVGKKKGRGPDSTTAKGEGEQTFVDIERVKRKEEEQQRSSARVAGTRRNNVGEED